MKTKLIITTVCLFLVFGSAYSKAYAFGEKDTSNERWMADQERAAYEYRQRQIESQRAIDRMRELDNQKEQLRLQKEQLRLQQDQQRVLEEQNRRYR
jgi:hypothetical protein